jgi:8-amino-7-oxononanoate synthase
MSPSFGLSFDAKARLIARLTSRMGTDSTVATCDESDLEQAAPPLGDPDVIEGLRMLRRSGDILGIENPYFVTHTGIAGAQTIIGNRSFDNFVSYNYLGLNGDPRVSEAAKAAIDKYGTSVSASRVVSGERPIHRALEEALAEANGTEDALAFVSGHATNVTVIGHLVGPRDAIVHDALCHNSIMQGIQLSGAKRVPFAHNDLAALDLKLKTIRPTVNRVLVIVEGHYSMDGDIPDLHGLVRLARRHRASLMVDEAHSLGVLGATGLGIAEHCGVDPRAIDLWMGTLSKTLSSSGGYVAGSKSLIDYLRCSAPGFVYSVGLAPATAAAATTALRIMRSEPERVVKLADNAAYFLTCAQDAGLQTGASIGAAIIPVMLGSSIRTAKVSDALRARGINVQPIMHPAVPERAARLRFFITALHTRDQLEQAVDQTAQMIATVASDGPDLTSLALKLASGSRRR